VIEECMAGRARGREHDGQESVDAHAQGARYRPVGNSRRSALPHRRSSP
jgi:hypothetical protein